MTDKMIVTKSGCNTFCNITQKELATTVGLSLRTIASYENSGVYPRTQDVYEKLASVLSCNPNYLKTEEKDVDYSTIPAPEVSFDAEAGASYESRGKQQAQQIVDQTTAIYAGDNLSDEDKNAFMREISSIFLIPKKKPKSCLRNTEWIPKMVISKSLVLFIGLHF